MSLRTLIAAALVMGAVAAHAAGSPAPAPSASNLQGLPRARALATLVDEAKADDPRRAVAYATEALALLRATPDPATEVRTRNELGWALMVLADYDHAVAEVERARDLAARSHNLDGEARAWNNLGAIAQKRGEPARAVELFQRSLALQRQQADAGKVAMALNNLGFVFAADLGDYAQGLAYHLQALRLRQELGDRQGIALSLNNIGIVYTRMRDYDRARGFLDQALRIPRELGPRARVAATLSNIGDLELERGRPAAALEAQSEALALRRDLGDNSGVASSLHTVGDVYLALDDLPRAEKALAEALRLGDEVGDRGLAIHNLLSLSALHRRQGHPEAARDEARRALAVAQGMGARDGVRQAWEAVAAANEAAGDPSAALAAYKQFKVENDAIFDEQRAKRMGLLQSRFAAERSQRQIEALQRERTIGSLRAESRQLQRDLLAGSMLVLGVLGFLLYRRRTEAARLAEQLSLTDSLTGLKNRRYVTQTLDADVAACLRRYEGATPDGRPQGADLIFFLLDLDRFKAVNDERGHAAGDGVLTQLAQLLHSGCRAVDVVARWGGEEFLVVGRFNDRTQAASQAERLRALVEGHAFDVGGGERLRRTASIGYASFPFATGTPRAVSWQQALDLADEALYLAKRSGRNAWVGIAAAGATAPAGLTMRGAGDLARWVARGDLLVESSVLAPALRWNERGEEGQAGGRQSADRLGALSPEPLVR